MSKRLIRYCLVIQAYNLQPRSQSTFSIWHFHFQFGWQQKDIFTTVTDSNVKVPWELGCVILVYILVTYPNLLHLFSQTTLFLCLKIPLDMRTLSRDGYKILSETKTMLFVTKVNSWKPLNILTSIFTSDEAGVLNSPLTETCIIVICTILDWK